MIIVKVNGGLCNQMYFFAAAYALSREWNEEIVIDCDVDGNAEWTYLLDEFQMPPYKKAVYPSRYQIGTEFEKIAPEIRERAVVIDETYFEKDGEYLTIPKEKFVSEYPGKDIYLKGTFLMRQMFVKYLPDLRKIFTLKQTSPFVGEFEKRIESETAVGVHIRKQAFAVLGDDNDMDFFMAAIAYMRQRYENARFYIFSDDLDVARQGLGVADDICYMNAANGYRGDIEEFVCLTKCHHYILTRRSTYGRMAEILNPRPDKVSVLFGGNTWNDSEDRFYFMSREAVEEYSRAFVRRPPKQSACEGQVKLLYENARLHAQKGEFGQAAHLCRMLEEQHGQDGAEFHEFFGDVLDRYGAAREAVAEYVRASRQKEIRKDLFGTEAFFPYRKLLGRKEKKHYVLAQYGPYTSQYVSEIFVLGLILGRMGNEVSFLLKRNFIARTAGVRNEKMVQWNQTIDDRMLALLLKYGLRIGRFYYGYPCYDYDAVRAQKQKALQEMAGRHPKAETIILGNDPEFIAADIPFRKIFVDFSAPFDGACLRSEVGEENIGHMYAHADIVIMKEDGHAGPGREVIRIDEGLLDRYRECEEEIPYYQPTIYTDDYLDIALNIALRSI